MTLLADSIYRGATVPAETTSAVLCTLLEAARKRSQTVQLMPEGAGMRFEVIDVRSGDYVRIVHVGESGMVWLTEGAP